MPISPLKKNRTYKDLDFGLTKHPSSRDVSVKSDVAAIKQSIKNLVLIQGKPFHPEINCGVSQLLFNPADVLLKLSIEDEISRILDLYEPRVIVNSVNVSFFRSNSVQVNIEFTIINSQETVNFDFIVERTR